MVEIGSVGGGLIGVAITPDGMRAYVVGTARYEVSAIDISTNIVVAPMPFKQAHWDNSSRADTRVGPYMYAGFRRGRPVRRPLHVRWFS